MVGSTLGLKTITFNAANVPLLSEIGNKNKVNDNRLVNLYLGYDPVNGAYNSLGKLTNIRLGHTIVLEFDVEIKDRINLLSRNNPHNMKVVIEKIEGMKKFVCEVLSKNNTDWKYVTCLKDTILINSNFSETSTLPYKIIKSEKVKPRNNENEIMISVSYPYFYGSREAENINNLLKSLLFYNKNIDKFINDLYLDLTNDHTRLYLSNKGHKLYSYYTLDSEEFLTDPLLTSLKFTNSIHNESAAHGHLHIEGVVINPKTGMRLSLKDIFILGFENRLNTLIEKKYRNMKGLSNLERLDSIKGELFDNKIAYSNNFYMTRNGITFIYNEYEIASYATGNIQINIPYFDISDILKNKYTTILEISH